MSQTPVMSPTSLKTLTPPKPLRRKALESLSPLDIPDHVTSIEPVPDHKPFTTNLGEKGIAFLLIPMNHAAEVIVRDNSSSGRVRTNPEKSGKSIFLINLDTPPKAPGKLIRFGRLNPFCDLLFDADEFPVEDECCFTIHPETGELQLHDLSDHQLTELWQGGKCRPDWSDSGTFRTCDVPLDKESYLSFGPAAFRLVPRPTSTREECDAFKDDLIAYAKQPISNKPLKPVNPIRAPWNLWALGPLALGRFTDVLFLPSRQPPSERRQAVVDYTRINHLGGASQGAVYRALETQSHRPLACKVVKGSLVTISAQYARNGADCEKELRVEPPTSLYHVSSVPSFSLLMLTMSQKNLVPYWHTQPKRNRVEVFMPTYEGSMFNIMFWCHHVGYAVCHHLLDIMFPQIVLALDYLHEQGLVHGNVKPQNILHRGKQFCLADWGIPKDPKDRASKWYRAPEVAKTGVPTEKGDIFSLGVILLETLETFPLPQQRHSIYPKMMVWFSDLQLMASRYGSLIQSMVAIDPRDRPSACDLIGKFPNWHRLNEYAPGAPYGDSTHVQMTASPAQDPQRTAASTLQTGLASMLQTGFTSIVKTELGPIVTTELAPTPQNSVPSVHRAEICQLQPKEHEKCIFLNEYLPECHVSRSILRTNNTALSIALLAGNVPSPAGRGQPGMASKPRCVATQLGRRH